MLIVKFFLVALSLFVQEKVFPDRDGPVSELDTLTLPEDYPETALARRAMAAEGLCPGEIARAGLNPEDASGIRDEVAVEAGQQKPRSYPADSPIDLAWTCD